MLLADDSTETEVRRECRVGRRGVWYVNVMQEGTGAGGSEVQTEVRDKQAGGWVGGSQTVKQVEWVWMGGK